MYTKKRKILFSILFLSLFSIQFSFAQTSVEIDQDVDIAIQKFKQDIEGGDKFLSKVKGYAVFPTVVKAGIIIGGKYAEGAVRVNGKSKSKFYLSMSSVSIGLQAGAQRYSMLIAFVTPESLKSFYKSDGWETGLEGSITIAQWGANKDMSSISFEKPIIAFIYNERGIMASINLSGTKFERIMPQ